MIYNTHTLHNQIRVIHHQIDSPVTHLGVILNTGSRDELPEEQGIAHFIEHTIFKGTKKRKAYHILSRLEDVGGELNAYTTKEETAVHCTFLNRDFNRAIELLSDILINANFPKKEIEKEKEVVIEEINSYKDTPSELIFDEFEELIFDGHPIARNILGTPQLVRNFNRNTISGFIKRNYHTDQMVICVVGKISFARLVRLLEKYFSAMPERLQDNERLKFNNYIPSTRIIEHDTFQCHCMIGNTAYHHRHPQRMALVLLNNLLGGVAMNSRLNMSLRERNGLAYNIESNYTAYSDTGLFSIYFGTDKENLERAQTIIHRELDKLKTNKLGILQLSKAKHQLIGQLSISQENREDLLLALGKTYLLYNKIDSLETIQQKIETITAMELLDVANEIFNSKQLSTLIIR